MPRANKTNSQRLGCQNTNCNKDAMNICLRCNWHYCEDCIDHHYADATHPCGEDPDDD